MVISLVAVVWLISGLARATEALPVKPDQAPALPTPRGAARTAQHTGQGPPSARVPQPPATLTGQDGAPMGLVPAGEFTMGSDEGDDDEQPVHRVVLDGFYLDLFEVTNGRFAKFVAAIQSEPPWGFADQETPVIHAERPVRWVTWLEATGYCLWAGKRLPTEAEWEKAARGPDGRVYPWGNDPPTPAQAVFGLKEGAETVAFIGNRDPGRSPYGIHDMVGNVMEWTSSWYLPYKGNSQEDPNFGQRFRVVRGASSRSYGDRYRLWMRSAYLPASLYDFGFRCARDGEAPSGK